MAIRFTGDRPTVVAVELSDEDGKTRLVLEHDRLPPEERASHAGGWGSDPGPALGHARFVSGREVTVHVDVRTETVIDRPREEVAAFTSTQQRHRVVPQHPIGRVGDDPTRHRRVADAVPGSLPRADLVYTYEVRELVSGEKVVMGTSDGPFSMETTYTFEDAPGGGTRVSLRNRGEPSGFAKALSPLMAKAMRRENTKDLERLKELVEGR